MTKPTKASLFLASVFILGWTLFILTHQYSHRNEPASDYPSILERGVLRVCGEYDRFSFYSDEKGQHGFHYELIHAFAENHNLKVVYLYEANFHTRLQWLSTGRCDLLTGPLPVLNSLRSTLAYTEPIYNSRLVLLQRSTDKPIRNQVNLAGRTLTMPANAPNLARISHLATEISDPIYVKEVGIFTSEELLKLVATGKVNLAVMDERVAKAWQANYPTIDCATPLSLSQFQAWAVRPNSCELLDSLNSFLIDYKKSPAFTGLLKKYGVN